MSANDIPLSDEDVLEIRRLANGVGCDKWTYPRLARKYGRTSGTIGRIVRGETHQRLSMERKVVIDEAQVAAEGQRLFEKLERERLEREAAIPDILKPKQNPYA